MRKIVFAIFLLISLSLVGYNLGGKLNLNPDKQVEKLSSDHKINNEFGIPVNILINSINVNTKIESVGMDNKGRMDVPKKVENVAWYNLGSKPGFKGSAVIAGHLDTPNGSPAVFYNLTLLKPGDEIEVSDSNGNKLVFLVEKKEIYDSDKFPLDKVFADTSGKKLNLITCNGTWDSADKNYLKRLVVYSALKE